MAEYKMTYEELEQLVDDSIANTRGNREYLVEYKIEILAALTGSFSDEISSNKKELEQLFDLWANWQNEKSQLLLGTRYIRIHDGMVQFIIAFITGGFLILCWQWHRMLR